MNALIEDLWQAAAQWKRSMKRIGEILVTLEQDESVDMPVLRSRLRDKYGMALATSDVAMRWARGELGDEETATELVSKVNHSRLSKLPLSAIDAVVNNEHRIRTIDGVKVKRFQEMTREEVNKNLLNQGFIPTENTKSHPRFRYSKAQGVELDESGRVMFVGNWNGELLRMSVPRRLLFQAVELIESSKAEATAAA